MSDGIEVVTAADAELGEGPVWDVRSGRLAWVDITGRHLHLTDTVSGATSTIDLPMAVGAVAPRAAGGFVAALQDGFWVVGDGPARRVAPIPETRPGLRFNDGKCDPAGRFWAGTMADDQTAGAGALYRLDRDGSVALVLQGVTVSNGLAWSRDGRTMFYIDTPTQRIDAFSFDPLTGEIGDRRPEVHLPREAGAPDGMTIDAEGGLWVALWGGGAVHRYLDGRLDRVIELPVSHPTSCCFGGDRLDELFVTSARQGLSAARLQAEPLAGALFRARPGVRGLAPAVFAGV
jgi:sugar lactone lactonase YvrE